MRRVSVIVVLCCVLWIASFPGGAAPSVGVVAGEMLGGTLGGLLGAAIAVTAIGEITPHLEPRAARVATVIAGVTLGCGAGAAVGVLGAGRVVDVEGNVTGCFLGAFAGGLASTFVEPIFYLLGVREGITEFLGMLSLPIAPAIGAVIGFNWTRSE